MNTQTTTYSHSNTRRPQPTQKDRIEMRYSEQTIRTMYAKHLAGLLITAPLEFVPAEIQGKAAGEQYEKVINTLASNWNAFTSTHTTEA